MQVAREFVARHCQDEDGVLILRYWRDGWWAWRTSRWREVDLEVEEDRLEKLRADMAEHPDRKAPIAASISRSWFSRQGELVKPLAGLGAAREAQGDRDLRGPRCCREFFPLG